MSDAQGNSPAPEPPHSRLRWFQFRLRTLLAAVTVVAGALWAFVLYVEPYRQQRRALEVVKQLGGRAVTAEAGPWQRRLLGADLQNITLIDLADWHQIDAYLPHVASLPCLETLVVGGEEFTDAHLRRLRPPKLTGLVLDSTSVTDEALAAWQEEHAAVEVYQSDRQIIASLPRSKSVDPLPEDTFKHPRLQQLVGTEYFQELQELYIPLDETLAPLARIRKLRHLNDVHVSGGGATDTDVERLCDVQQVISLSLHRSEVTDRGLACVARLGRLRSLNLEDTKTNDKGVAHLASLMQLESLSLWNTRVTDAGLRHLCGLSKLKRLELSKTRITDAGLQHLALSELIDLGLEETRVTDAGLAHLTPLMKLQRLDLSGTAITDAGLLQCSSWPNLADLWLGETRITDAGLTRLHGLKRLASLNIYETRVTSAGVDRLKAVFPRLNLTWRLP